MSLVCIVWIQNTGGATVAPLTLAPQDEVVYISARAKCHRRRPDVVHRRLSLLMPDACLTHAKWFSEISI